MDERKIRQNVRLTIRSYPIRPLRNEINIICPLKPKKDYPHGFADITRTAKPFLNIIRAVPVTIASPAPIYVKLSLRYDLSAIDRESRVSLFKIAFVPTAAPRTTA